MNAVSFPSPDATKPRRRWQILVLTPLVLVVVFKNLAAYDRPLADAEKSAATQYGSLDKAHDMGMQRETWRKILGTEIYRQLAFTH